MKSVVQKLQVLCLRPHPTLNYFPYYYHYDAGIGNSLTQDEIDQINRLIPSLCSSSNHLKRAIHLISSAVLTAKPPITSLPLSILIDRLTVEPDLTLSMYFFNALRYNGPLEPQILTPIAVMFVSSFFNKGHPKQALKIFHLVSRLGVLAKDSRFYTILVDGFCKNGMMLDALRVLKVMVGENSVVGTEVKTCIYRGLLREARIREAMDLNACLSSDTLGRIIARWVE